MKLEKVLELIDEVPDYQVFLTVDELNESSRRLAEQHPQVVEWKEVGKSRTGDPIRVLKIGSGKKNALLFAMPHPNEPIGSMMLEFLSQKLAEDEALRDELGYTWYIIKCIDVDGTRLNEKWFKGPFSVTNYARHYYRPPSFQQVEWTFPVEYKTLKYENPMPETQALMNLIEATKPDFMFSLHNSGFGGVYLYLSDDFPGFYPDFYKLVQSQGLPLHLGEPEVPYAQKHSDAVFGMIGIQDSYDFMAQNLEKDPAEIIQGGASSFEYAKRHCNPLFLVCEMPYFYNPAIHDTSRTNDIRRDLILQGLEQSRQKAVFFRQKLAEVKELLTLETPFKETIENNLKFYEEHFKAQENWAKNDPSLEENATVAERFDNLLSEQFYQLLSTGTFVRMLEAQIEHGGENDRLKKTLQEVEAVFEKDAAELESALKYEVVPIKKLVSVQLGCALLLASNFVS